MNALGSVAEAAVKFAAEHLDLVALIADAFAGGVTKEALVAAIKQEMTAAARLELERELKP